MTKVMDVSGNVMTKLTEQIPVANAKFTGSSVKFERTGELPLSQKKVPTTVLDGHLDG
jgi:hypothetical protein